MMNFFISTLCLWFTGGLLVWGNGSRNDGVIMKSYPRSVKAYSRQAFINSMNSVSAQALHKNVTLRVNSLALAFDRMLSKCHTDDNNILIAPINIIKTLSTVMLGTGGKTEQELANALGVAFGQPINSISPRVHSIPEFHRAMGYLLRKVTTNSTGVTFGTNLDIAGGVFLDRRRSINPNFRKLARDIYLTQTYSLDYHDDGKGSADFINQWAANKTHGRINQIVSSPINPLTNMIIAGALYFNGNWEKPFYAKITRWQPFYTSSEGKYGNQKVFVELMANQGKIPYYENSEIGYQAIGIPFENREIYMIVALPRLQLPLRDLLCSFNEQEIDSIVSKWNMTDVFYVLPKMKLSFETNLKDTVEKLGVRTLFDPQLANFSSLASGDDARGLYASSIIHKVEMEVNEVGATAAATTTVSVVRGGFVNFRADRPFFFFMYNVKVGVMTFWGSVQKPTPFKANIEPVSAPN